MPTRETFGPITTIGSISIPTQYQRHAFIDTFVKSVHGADTTWYLGNFVTANNFDRGSRDFRPDTTYNASLVPLFVPTDGESAAAFLQASGSHLVGAVGLCMLHAQLPSLFPPNQYVAAVDVRVRSPKDRSGYRRFARFRYFWHPQVDRWFWEYGAGYLAEELRAGDYLLHLRPA